MKARALFLALGGMFALCSAIPQKILNVGVKRGFDGVVRLWFLGLAVSNLQNYLETSALILRATVNRTMRGRSLLKVSFSSIDLGETC